MYEDIVDQFYEGQPVYYMHPRDRGDGGGHRHDGIIAKVEPFIRGKRLHINFEGMDNSLLYTVTYEVCCIWPVDELPKDPEWEV
jgi:hypothetical protein